MRWQAAIRLSVATTAPVGLRGHGGGRGVRRVCVVHTLRSSARHATLFRLAEAATAWGFVVSKVTSKLYIIHLIHNLYKNCYLKEQLYPLVDMDDEDVAESNSTEAAGGG